MSAVLDKYGCTDEDSGFIYFPHGYLWRWLSAQSTALLRDDLSKRTTDIRR